MQQQGGEYGFSGAILKKLILDQLENNNIDEAQRIFANLDNERKKEVANNPEFIKELLGMLSNSQTITASSEMLKAINEYLDPINFNMTKEVVSKLRSSSLDVSNLDDTTQMVTNIARAIEPTEGEIKAAMVAIMNLDPSVDGAAEKSKDLTKKLEESVGRVFDEEYKKDFDAATQIVVGTVEQRVKNKQSIVAAQYGRAEFRSIDVAAGPQAQYQNAEFLAPSEAVPGVPPASTAPGQTVGVGAGYGSPNPAAAAYQGASGTLQYQLGAVPTPAPGNWDAGQIVDGPPATPPTPIVTNPIYGELTLKPEPKPLPVPPIQKTEDANKEKEGDKETEVVEEKPKDEKSTIRKFLESKEGSRYFFGFSALALAFVAPPIALIFAAAMVVNEMSPVLKPVFAVALSVVTGVFEALINAAKIIANLGIAIKNLVSGVQTEYYKMDMSITKYVFKSLMPAKEADAKSQAQPKPQSQPQSTKRETPAPTPAPAPTLAPAPVQYGTLPVTPESRGASQPGTGYVSATTARGGAGSDDQYAQLQLTPAVARSAGSSMEPFSVEAVAAAAGVQGGGVRSVEPAPVPGEIPYNQLPAFVDRAGEAVAAAAGARQSIVPAAIATAAPVAIGSDSRTAAVAIGNNAIAPATSPQQTPSQNTTRAAAVSRGDSGIQF